jgi:signal transduction histidine kinase
MDQYIKQVADEDIKGLSSALTFRDFMLKYRMDNGFNLCFLELPNRLIEVRIKKGIFEDQDAHFLSFVDCSTAQRLEKAKTENRCKTLIMSTVSHELRTPVSAILGSLEVIEQYIPPEGKEYLEIAKNSCNMLSFQINDLTVIIIFTILGLWKTKRSQISIKQGVYEHQEYSG